MIQAIYHFKTEIDREVHDTHQGFFLRSEPEYNQTCVFQWVDINNQFPGNNAALNHHKRGIQYRTITVSLIYQGFCFVLFLKKDAVIGIKTKDKQ